MNAKHQIRLFGKANFRNLCKGFEFDPSGWGGAAPIIHDDNTIDNAYWRVKAPKALKENIEKTKSSVYPSIPTLADDSDKVRSLDQHREMVDSYAKAYELGYDPLSGEPLSPEETKKAKDLSSIYEAKLWRAEGRNVGCHQSEGLALLTQAFLQSNEEID